MPEGHTLHRLAGVLDRAFAGTVVRANSPQGRFVEGAARLDGRRCERAEAWGKHLFVTFEDDLILNVHLGLIGVFDVLPYAGGPGHEPPAVGAVRLRLVNDTHVADLRAMTVVDVVTPEKLDATVARLGPDPLRVGQSGNDPQRSLAKLARTDRPVAELLMDQSVIAGVGNVYRAEVLFRHRVAPMTPGRQVRPRTWLAMWEDLVALLPLGVAFGQIITLPEQEAARCSPKGRSRSTGRAAPKVSGDADPAARHTSRSRHSPVSMPSTNAPGSPAWSADRGSVPACSPDAPCTGAAAASVAIDLPTGRPNRRCQ